MTGGEDLEVMYLHQGIPKAGQTRRVLIPRIVHRNTIRNPRSLHMTCKIPPLRSPIHKDTSLNLPVDLNSQPRSTPLVINYPDRPVRTSKLSRLRTRRIHSR